MKDWNENPAGENPDPPPNSRPLAPLAPPPLPTTANDAAALRVSQLNRIHYYAYQKMVEAHAALKCHDSARAMSHIGAAMKMLEAK